MVADMHRPTSLVFLAVAAVLLLAGQVRARLPIDLCLRTEYPDLCRHAISGKTDPFTATESSIRSLIFEAKKAKMYAAGHEAEKDVDICFSNFEDSIDNLETSLNNLRVHDKTSLNINLNAALTDFVTCEDELSNPNHPLKGTSLTLRHMASNCLALAESIL